MKYLKIFEKFFIKGWEPGDIVVYVKNPKPVDRSDKNSIWLRPGDKCKIEKILLDEPYMVLRFETMNDYHTLRQLKTDFITLEKWKEQENITKYNL